jgi:hypothetical protein
MSAVLPLPLLPACGGWRLQLPARRHTAPRVTACTALLLKHVAVLGCSRRLPACLWGACPAGTCRSGPSCCSTTAASPSLGPWATTRASSTPCAAASSRSRCRTAAPLGCPFLRAACLHALVLPCARSSAAAGGGAGCSAMSGRRGLQCDEPPAQRRRLPSLLGGQASRAHAPLSLDRQ